MVRYIISCHQKLKKRFTDSTIFKYLNSREKTLCQEVGLIFITNRRTRGLLGMMIFHIVWFLLAYWYKITCICMSNHNCASISWFPLWGFRIIVMKYERICNSRVGRPWLSALSTRFHSRISSAYMCCMIWITRCSSAWEDLTLHFCEDAWVASTLE